LLTPPRYATFGEAYIHVLDHITTDFQYRNAPRGNMSRERLGLSFQVDDPRDRLPFIAARKVNPVFHFAETLWYLGARNDVEMIAYYSPIAAQDSRDGKTLNGYGTRIFQADGAGLSPFDRVLHLLQSEGDSKRGVLPVFEGAELAAPSGPHNVSCLVALHLLAREGRLHMVCYMRANEVYRGLLGDVFAFTMIQELAAIQLGLELGAYIHHIGSAHINEPDVPQAQLVIAEAAAGASARFAFPAMPADTTLGTVAAVLEHEGALRRNQVQYRPGDVAALGLAPYWQHVVLLFEVHRQLAHERGPIDAEVLGALDPGLRWLVAHRWPKRTPETGSAR
jgi:thymidylate synthase